MERNSSWTGRAPRSMRGAFGPYTSDHISEPLELWVPARFTWRLLVAIAIVLILVVSS